jgi:hypothetical protein
MVKLQQVGNCIIVCRGASVLVVGRQLVLVYLNVEFCDIQGMLLRTLYPLCTQLLDVQVELSEP